MPNDALNWISWTCFLLTGQLLLAKGEVEQASAAFKIVLDGDRDNVPALLGQVCRFVLLDKALFGNFNLSKIIPFFFFNNMA